MQNFGLLMFTPILHRMFIINFMWVYTRFRNIFEIIINKIDNFKYTPFALFSFVFIKEVNKPNL